MKQQFLHRVDSKLFQPTMGHRAEALLECSRKVARREVALRCDLGQTEVTLEVGPQHVLGAAPLPGRQAAAHRRRRGSCSRTVRNEMGAQCLVNLVQKQS